MTEKNYYVQGTFYAAPADVVAAIIIMDNFSIYLGPYPGYTERFERLVWIELFDSKANES